MLNSVRYCRMPCRASLTHIFCDGRWPILMRGVDPCDEVVANNDRCMVVRSAFGVTVATDFIRSSNADLPFLPVSGD